MATLRRYLIDRWRPTLELPADWTVARQEMRRVLGALQRVLDVLHPAVEHPPARVETIVAATANTTINAVALADITGTTYTFTPEVTGTVLASAAFDVQCALFGAVNQPFSGALVVNGVAETAQAMYAPTAVNLRITIGQTWSVPVTAGTAYTIKLQGATANVGTTYTVAQTHTTLTLLFIPAAWKVNL